MHSAIDNSFIGFLASFGAIKENEDGHMEILETFSEFNVSIAMDLNLLSTTEFLEKIKQIFEQISARDTLLISIRDEVDFITGLSFGTSLEAEAELPTTQDLHEGSGYLTIQIQKNIIQNISSIYSIELLTSWLNNIESFSELINEFASNKHSYQFLYDEINSFSTNLYLFSKSCSEEFDSEDDGLRSEIFSKINESTHISGLSIFNKLPEDFYSDNYAQNESMQRFILLLKRISLILSLSSLVDFTNFEKNNIYYKLIGYKNIDKKYDVNEINIDTYEEYYESYLDIYHNSDNSTDKLGLARNVISLHIIDKDFTNIQDNILASIQSNYKIYLKENVTKYLDVKSKITESLIAHSNKYDTIVANLSTSFRTSFYTLTSIFLSMILMRLIKNNTGEFFTFGVSLFITGIIFGLLVFSIYNIKESEALLKRYKEQYDLLKEQYLDVLDETNINQIVSNDKSFNSNEAYVKEQIEKYRDSWLIVLGIYFTITWIAHFS